MFYIMGITYVPKVLWEPILIFLEKQKVLKEQWGDSDNYINDLLNYSKDLQQELDKYKHIVEEIKKMFDDNKLNEYYYGMSYEFGEGLRNGLLKIIESEDK